MVVTTMEWTWDWTPPVSASFGDNPVFDWIRVVAVVLAVLLLCATGRVLVEAARRHTRMPRTQVARFAGLSLACLSLALTEVAVVGTPATPRLMVTLAALSLSLYGVHGMRNKQRSDPPVR